MATRFDRLDSQDFHVTSRSTKSLATRGIIADVVASLTGEISSKSIPRADFLEKIRRN